MNLRRLDLLLIVVTHVAVLLGVGLKAEAGLFGFGGDSWKEEVLLHDGSKLVVTRSQTYGGRHEIGQPSPIKEHTVTFTLPGSKKALIWTSEYDEDLGRTNFLLLAVDMLNGTPYIVAQPNLCLSYNKWGRPNPPYVFFKYDGTAWQRIPLKAVPAEFSTLNVAISLDTRYVQDMVARGVVPAETIRQRNSELTQPEFKTLLREPVKLGAEGSAVNCPEMVFYKGAWVGPGDSIGKRMKDRESK